MAKTLVDQYNDLRAKLLAKDEQAKIDVVNILTDISPILDQLSAIQAELIPGENTYNQIGHILTVTSAVKQGFQQAPAMLPAQMPAPVLTAPAE